MRMNAQSLVDEIKLCLKNGASSQDVVRLGHEYAATHASAIKRLHRCVDLIREGKESTALQEAQFAPPLMEVLESLAFPQLRKWSKELEKNGLVVPASLDSKHISMMGELFAKPIDGSDPLYNDLAHAMRTKDKGKALNILRIIRRKNPSDSNAAEQLRQVETFIQNGKILKLAKLVEEKNDEFFREAMDSFDAEPWESKPKGNDWKKVLAHDHLLRKEASLKRCKSLISELLSLRETGDWEMGANLVSQLDGEISKYGFSFDERVDASLEDSYMDVLETSRTWILSAEQKEHRAREDKKREDKLKVVVRSIQDKEIGRKRKTVELRTDLAKLTSVGRDLEEEGQSLSEEDLKNFNRCLIRLREEISKRQKALRVMIMAGCLIAALLGAASFYLISERLHWNERYETLVSGLETHENADNLEAFLDSFEKNNPELMTEVEFESEIQNGRKEITQARAFNDDFGEKIRIVLEEIAQASGLDLIKELLARKTLLWEELNNLNPAYLERRQEQLREVDLNWNQKRDLLQSKISKDLITKLSESQSFAETHLVLDQLPEDLQANLDEFNSLLVGIEAEAKMYAEVDGLGLSSGQQDMLDSLRTNYDAKKAALVSFDQVVESIEQSESLDSLLASLDEMIATGLVGSAEYQAAQEILLSRSLFSDIEARRFLPKSPQDWKSAPESLTSSYKPDKILSKEVEILKKLLEDERTKNIFSSPFYSSKGPKHFERKIDSWFPRGKDSLKGKKWSAGNQFQIELNFKRGVTGAGSYILSQKAKIISDGSLEEKTFKSEWVGISRTFDVVEENVLVLGDLILGGSLNEKQTVLSFESEYLHSAKSEFSEFFSSDQINFSPLLFLDSLKRQNLDPFIATQIFLAVCQSMDFRPNEWGLKNNPQGTISVEDHYRQLSEIVGNDDLIHEWYKYISTGIENELRKKLLNFYQSFYKWSYFKEAKFFEKFWRELFSSQFKFQGFCNLDGKWSDSITGYVWALSAKYKKIQVVRPDAKEALPYSPILTLDKNFSDIVKDSRAYAGFKDSKDENYLKIKKKLPYPFNFLPEDE